MSCSAVVSLVCVNDALMVAFARSPLVPHACESVVEQEVRRGERMVLEQLVPR